MRTHCRARIDRRQYSSSSRVIVDGRSQSERAVRPDVIPSLYHQLLEFGAGMKTGIAVNPA